ncbi:hypothetical protein [Flavobacterium coralii]
MKSDKRSYRHHHTKSRYAEKVREYKDARDRIVLLILILIFLFFIYLLL